MEHFATRLSDAVRRAGTPLCVGLDPRWSRLPESIRRRHGDTRRGRARAYEEFCCRVLDVVQGEVGVVKPQSAFFEHVGPVGMEALFHVIRHAKRHGLLVIVDAKRNDIAATAQAYAEAVFDFYAADAVTVNPYLGGDSIEPFTQTARRHGGGVFVLVRTSNPGAGEFQDRSVDGQPLHLRVAEAVNRWSRDHATADGWGDVGAVVGATAASELAELRRRLDACWLLVPGYGAQGATAADTAPAFRPDGLGAIVNSSRAILYAAPPEQTDWESAVAAAVQRAKAELAGHTPASALRK